MTGKIRLFGKPTIEESKIVSRLFEDSTTIIIVIIMMMMLGNRSLGWGERGAELMRDSAEAETGIV